MGGYVVSFTVYTMAMVGLICFAVFVYKKVTEGSMLTGKTKCLEIEETMSINPRKSLHIIRAGKERFLIASDVDKTTLIAKLENNEKVNIEDIVDIESLESSNKGTQKIEESQSQLVSIKQHRQKKTTKINKKDPLKDMANKINNL